MNINEQKFMVRARKATRSAPPILNCFRRPCKEEMRATWESPQHGRLHTCCGLHT